jgi:hypothetical protein
MKSPRLILWTFGLLAVLLASACAPASTATPAPQSTVTPEMTLTSAPAATLAPTQAALPVATSRGPNLEATDPATVALASGQLQLVEFFRFT